MSDEDTDRVSCPDCQKTFENKAGLGSHRARVHNTPDEPYLKRYKRIRNEIPEKYRDVYDVLTGSGKPPNTIQATVEYIETNATQDKIATEFGVADLTIRKNVRLLIDRGVVSLAEVRENNPDNGYRNFGEDRQNGQKSINL